LKTASDFKCEREGSRKITWKT